MDEQMLQALMLRASEGGVDAQFNPLMREAMRLQNEAARQAMQTPDTSGYARAGFDRERRGMDDVAAGMAMATAIPQFAQIAQQTHRAGLEAQQPMEMGEGMYMPGTGYVADPFKKQDRLTKATANQGAAAASFASAYGGEAERLRADQRQREQMEESRRHARVMEGISGGQLALARSQADLGKIQKVQQADGSEILVRIMPNGQAVPLALPGAVAAAGPGQFPAVAHPKASDDEKKTTFMLNSILASAKHLNPSVSKPGFFEAAGRMLPGETGLVAGNVLSSAERQGTRSSQEGIVDNLLTLSTGLSYTPMQLAAKRMEYLPSYTDKPGHEAIKRAKLVDMITAARARAGRAWTADHERALQVAFPELAAGGVSPSPAAGGAAPTAPGAGSAVNPGAVYGWRP